MKNLTFTTSEKQAMLLLSFVYTIFLVFFTFFGQEILAADFVFAVLVFFVCMILTFFIHELGHKIAAEFLGYHAQVIQFTSGIIASAIITIYSFGNIPLLTGNLLLLEADPRRRLHRRRKYDNEIQQAIISGAGIAASLLAITTFRILHDLTGSQLFFHAQIGAGLHAIYSLIPFELLSILKLRMNAQPKKSTPSDGLYIIRASTTAWVFVLIFSIIFLALSLIQVPATLIIAIVLSTVTTVAYAKLLSD